MRCSSIDPYEIYFFGRNEVIFNEVFSQGVETPLSNLPAPRRGTRNFEDHNYVNTSITQNEVSSALKEVFISRTFYSALYSIGSVKSKNQNFFYSF